MTKAYHTLLHLLGAACIAACLVIVGTKGDLDIHWSGWIAVAFFAVLALGILCGWFPWRGRPLRVLLKGVYVMSALALMGFGFALSDPLRPPLWAVLAMPGAAIVVRIVIKLVFRIGSDPASAASADAMTPRRRTTHDTLFG